MKNKYVRPALLSITLVVFSLITTSCDIGVNPLIIDGTPTEATFVVNSSYATFPPLSFNVNLQDVLTGIAKEVDSIKAYNITMLIDGTDGTDPNLNGRIVLKNGVNVDTLLTMKDTPISPFASERTIFDTKLHNDGFNYSPTIVTTINGCLKQDPKPTVTVTASGSANQGPLHFTIHVKVYTQVFIKGKN